MTCLPQRFLPSAFFMKSLSVAALLALCLICGTTNAQPVNSFVNNGSLTSVVNIDAYNFLNTGSIDFSTATAEYGFYDVNNYTNRNQMTSLLGWLFNTDPTDGSAVRPANVFVNTSAGTITASSPSLRSVDVHGVGLYTAQFISPIIDVQANHLTNQGAMHAGSGGIIRLSGQTVSIKNSSLTVDGVGSSATNQVNVIGVGGILTSIRGFYPGLTPDGIYDTYWGVGTDTNQQMSFSIPVFAESGRFNETNSTVAGLGALTSISTFLDVLNPAVYTEAFYVNNDQSNIVWQFVLVGNGNLDTNTTMDVRFAPAAYVTGKNSDFDVPVVSWTSVTTQYPGATPVTNTLYLTDDFATRTNGINIVKTNGASLSGVVSYSPTNYAFSRTYPLGVPWASLNTSNYPGALVLNQGLGVGFTNAYAAYGVTLEPSTATLDSSRPLQAYTNIPGRIEINAGVLDANRARIQGANYVHIGASNNFLGSANAQIAAPVMDFNLVRSDGIVFAVSNLVTPSIQSLSGTVDCYSCRFTNVMNGVTNRYSFLFVESALSSLTASAVQDFIVRATNAAVAGYKGQLTISDVVNVSSNLLVVADQVTITTNLSGAINTNGQLNVATDNNWATNFPNLTRLTNFGQISFPGFVNFVGQRQAPYYSSSFTEPYQTMVNHGTITASGVSILANYFESTGNFPVTNNQVVSALTLLTNTIFLPTSSLIYPIYSANGTLTTFGGDLTLQAGTMILGDGELDSQTADINLTANNLVLTNTFISSAGQLNLAISNQVNATLDGSGRFATNTIQASGGFNLWTQPGLGDLLGTTVYDYATTYFESVTTWAGLDYGDSPLGFTNNMALGHLVLDGLSGSTFEFYGATGSNALYVDLLELQDSTTNRSNPDLTGVYIDPSITIYFAGAWLRNANGTVFDISEKLNHANGNSLRWVPSFAGVFSGTNVSYPSGKSYFLNRALVQSTVIDSNGNGIPNAYDPAPVFVPDQLAVSISVAGPSSPGAVKLSWSSLANAVNYVDSRNAANGSSWTTVTNFTSTVTGVVSATVIPSSKDQFFRVRVAPQQP